MQLTKTGVYFGAIFHAICCTWMLVVANGPSTDEEIRKHVDVRGHGSAARRGAHPVTDIRQANVANDR